MPSGFGDGDAWILHAELSKKTRQKLREAHREEGNEAGEGFFSIMVFNIPDSWKTADLRTIAMQGGQSRSVLAVRHLRTSPFWNTVVHLFYFIGLLHAALL